MVLAWANANGEVSPAGLCHGDRIRFARGRHKPDEYVPLDEFVAASLIYRDMALAMLGGS